MGIQGLTKLIGDFAERAISEHAIQSYFGRRVAVDASMSMYQFMVTSELPFSFDLLFLVVLFMLLFMLFHVVVVVVSCCFMLFHVVVVSCCCCFMLFHVVLLFYV